MRTEIARPLAVLTAVTMSAVIAFAQPEGVPVWKGLLHSDSRKLFQEYAIELTDKYNHRVASADVGADGSFEFHSVTGGDYQLIVSNGRGEELYRSYVTVSGASGDLDVRLPEEKIERPPSGGVSVSQLLHPPGRKAVDCVMRAQKLSQSGQYAKAASELEKAVRISPDYADAHTNLGAQYLRLGRYREALDESERAMRIGPLSALTLSNRAYAQQMLERYPEAIRSARWSLRLDPDFAPAHYILGLSLVLSGQSIPEAISHLAKAAESLPTARVNLERLRAEVAMK